MFPVAMFQQSVRKLTSILDRHKIRFHLTGGVTGTAYGEPRMTQDIDIVISPEDAKANLSDFIKSLRESDFMFAEPSLQKAIATTGMFQLLDGVESLKFDIYPRELVPGELQRSERIEVFPGELLPVVSRVDAALSKLIWVQKGSSKSRKDFRAIFRRVHSDQQTEITEGARRLGLIHIMNEVLSERDEIGP